MSSTSAIHLVGAVLDDRRAGDALHGKIAVRMSIVENRKAFHDYFIEERYEAGHRARGLGGEGDPRRPRAASATAT